MLNKRLITAHELENNGVPFRTDVCGRDCTSFRIGGRLALFAEPRSEAELAAAVAAAETTGYRCFVIGNGSNLLIPDDGVDALFIRLSGRLTEFRIEGNTVFAGAGASLAATAKAAVASGLAGMEWASGIPGSIGGAVAMNAGAYGGEIKDIIRSVRIFENGRIIQKQVCPGDMAYRHSAYSYPGCIVLSAEFVLSKDDGSAQERMREFSERRREKQPVELPSAGSTFKRPEGHFAAALIDQAGLKGLALGGACVSPKHAGFIVNNGGATYDDVVSLIEIIKTKVFEQFGVKLEPEVKIL